MKWTVTKQVPTILPTSGGTPTRGYQVSVETDTGHTDQVFIPEAAYTPDRAREIISDHLANVAAIGSLTGEV